MQPNLIRFDRSDLAADRHPTMVIRNRIVDDAKGVLGDDVIGNELIDVVSGAERAATSLCLLDDREPDPPRRIMLLAGAGSQTAASSQYAAVSEGELATPIVWRDITAAERVPSAAPSA